MSQKPGQKKICTLKAFLTVLRRTRARLPHGKRWKMDQDGFIFLRTVPLRLYTPLTWIARYVTGEFFDLEDFEYATEVLGLPVNITEDIVTAAATDIQEIFTRPLRLRNQMLDALDLRHAKRCRVTWQCGDPVRAYKTRCGLN